MTDWLTPQQREERASFGSFQVRQSGGFEHGRREVDTPKQVMVVDGRWFDDMRPSHD